ncbi:MAG: TonB-dependent receptor [Gemmatimonadetes bacterium]|nr:TonB-dependent receptor [Gemmatimonadota bacterium]
MALAWLALAFGRSDAQQSRSGADSTRADSLARFRLAPIEVTVTRAAAQLTRLASAVEVVTREDLGPGRPRLGLDEALAGVPGVVAVNRQNYAQDLTLSIRGFGARSAFGVRGVKILLDGIPQTLPDGQGQLTNVDLDDVERVEVLRGTASSLYGNASGGVVSLWTRGDARPARVAPDARVLVGAYGLTKYRATLEAPLGRGSVSVTGARTATDGFRAHSEAELRRGRLRLGVPLGRTSVTLIAQAADDPNLKDPGALTQAEMDTAPSLANPTSVLRDAGKRVSQHQAGLTVARTLASGGTLTATIFGLRRDLENPTTATYIELARRAYGLRAATTLPLALAARTGTLSAGFDTQWQRDDRVNRNVQRTQVTLDQLEHVSEVGPFVEVMLEPWRPVTLTLGARYDRVSFQAEDRLLTDGDDSGTRVMSAASGSSGLAVELVPGFAPYSSVSTSFQTPTTTELTNRPAAVGGFNPDLRPQTAVNYELGARGQLDRRLRYSIALFRADIRGELIPFEVTAQPGRRFFRNAGSSRQHGVEVSLTAAPLPVLRVGAAYTYSRRRFQDYQTSTAVLDGNDVPGIPRHYVWGVATYRFRGRAWVSMEQKWSSAYYVDDANTVQNGAWWATSVRAGLEIVAAGWRIAPFGGIANLFDERYAASVLVNAQFGRYFEPAPGRNAYVGVEVGAVR